MKIYTTIVEKTILSLCVTLMLLAWLFGKTNGLMDENGQYTSTFNGGAGDDNICISIGIFWFGLVMLLLPWFRGRALAVWLKVVAYIMALIMQFLSLTWMDAGSISTTIDKGNNIVLNLYLTTIEISVPIIACSLVYWIGWHRRQRKSGVL